MTKTAKALLLSALLFPGSGHLMLKRHVMASILIGVSVICLYVLASNAIDIANDISAKILNGSIPLDVKQISDAVSEALHGENSRSISLCSWLLLLTWLGGIADSWRVAKQQQTELSP